MEGKGTPKNKQNQFCHSPSVKAVKMFIVCDVELFQLQMAKIYWNLPRYPSARKWQSSSRASSRRAAQ